MNERVGFVGLGIMGSGMARNLLDAEATLAVWNRTPSKADPLVEAGAAAVPNLPDLAREAAIIFLCVSDTPDVESVLFGDGGLVEGLQQGALVVDCSTISPTATKQFAARLKEQGVHMLDAPISGGSEGAIHGTLSIMVGGEAEQVERALPYLQVMGKKITHVGGHGAGQMTKLVNQILVAGSMLSLGEALLFAQAGGLDLERTLEAVSDGAAGSWTLRNRGPQVIQRDWSPGFMIDLQEKDLRLVLQEADELSVPTLGTSTAFHLYRSLQRRGLGTEGNHALVRALEFMSDLQIGQ